MDYAAIHGQDESNFTFRSQHRLPTQSAADALREGKNGAGKAKSIRTGMKGIDRLLSDVGGVRRGVVTEIWGPPGVGKTAIAMELAASALREGERVLWLSGQDPVAGPRFVGVLSKVPSPVSPPSQNYKYVPTLKEKGMLRNFKHLPYRTIVYLSWKLLASDDPTSGFPPPGTSLFVIDKLDELIDKQCPQGDTESPEEKQKRGNKPPESLLNYWKTVHHAIRMLNKFAAKHNVAVVVLTPIDVKHDVMAPGIDTQAWEMGVATRIMLWRQDMGDKNQDVRLGRTMKKDGVVSKGEVFGFNVTQIGVEEVPVFAQDMAGLSQPYYDNANDRTNSYAVQQAVAVEEGWNVEEPEEGYEDDAEAYPDMPGLVTNLSPPPPSSPPISTTQIDSDLQSTHAMPPARPARTPSPTTDAPHLTETGTPVKNVQATNLFAGDPQPLWDDEAPQVSFVSAQAIMRDPEPSRYQLDVSQPTLNPYVQARSYNNTQDGGHGLRQPADRSERSLPRTSSYGSSQHRRP